MSTCCGCHKRKAIKGAAKCNKCGIANRLRERLRGAYNKRETGGVGRPTKYRPKGI